MRSIIGRDGSHAGLRDQRLAFALRCRPPRCVFLPPPAPPDSLAAPTALVGTLRVQGQPQPSAPFQTFREQLGTGAGGQVRPYAGAPGTMTAVRIRGWPARPATRSPFTW